MLFLGCKTTSDQSELNKYEIAEYDGKNICELMSLEAFEVTEDSILDVEAKFLSIRSREMDIYEDLIDTINDCKSSGSTANADGPGGERTCDSIDPKRLEIYQSKLALVQKCPTLDSAFTVEMAKEIPFDPKDRQQKCDEIRGELPEWFNEKCQVNEVQLGAKRTWGQAAACDMINGLLQVSGTDDATVASCTSDPVVDVCGRVGAIKRLTDPKYTEKVVKDENKKLIAELELDLTKLSKDFNREAKQCLTAFALPAIKKHGLDDGVELVSSVAFKMAIDHFVKNAAAKRNFNLKRFIALKACEYGTNALAGKVANDSEKFQSDACSNEALRWDKHQTAACLRTASDHCSAAAGVVDFSGLTQLEDDQVLARTAQAVAEGGISAACGLGGTAGNWACGTIAKSAGYIRDAFKGKSNPWADCAGTTKVGRCVGQKLWELSSGIKATDLQVGVDQVKKTKAGKRTRLMCWCWQECYKDYRWPKSNQFFNREFRFSAASAGAPGVRMCDAMEKKHKYKGKFEGENVLYYINDCSVVHTRQVAEGAYLPPGGTVEIWWKGKWGTYRVPPEKYACSYRK
jgi:hypothetical protein